ncbi:MAG: DUF3047 domain-containing protein [Burkholderiaceae bacterium]
MDRGAAPRRVPMWWAVLMAAAIGGLAGCALPSGGGASAISEPAASGSSNASSNASNASSTSSTSGVSSKSSTSSTSSAPAAIPAKLLRTIDLPLTGTVPLFAGAPGKEVPDGWELWTLHPSKARTRYRLGRDADGVTVAAQAESGASGLVRRLSLSPLVMPMIEWRWKVDQLIPGADNTDRYAEDAPVRIVLAFDGDKRSLPLRERMFFEQVRLLSGQDMPYATLMYIWENKQPVGTVILNPNTSRVRKLVVASGDKQLKRWQRFRRNVVADYIQAFGKPPGNLIGVAILTDTDNTRQRASALYGDLRIGRLPMWEGD